MCKFGFGANFINWIRGCISEPWIAPLVNGRATNFFKASRGLRQGCPLSPLLFVIQASALSFLLDKKLHEQEINGLCIARGTKNINHALFADDTLLLGPASVPSATKFKEVLDEFSEASGSVVNKSKCHIFSWNTTPRLLSAISRCLGFEATTSWSSFKHLGLPISHKRPTSKEWLPQLEKFKAKIQAWGYSWLNTAGKTVLIKSVLNSLPLFQFAGLLAPASILNKMEEYIRRFFWKGGKQNENKIPLISWDIISKPLWEGGLNFKNLCHQNVAMAAKIIWRIIAPNLGWTQKVLWKKYFRGPRSRCLEKVIRLPNSTFLKIYDRAASLIIAHSYWIPGNRKKINIWSDIIMNKEPIEVRASINSLRCWMDREGMQTLWDISCWNDSIWAGWKQLKVSNNLNTEWIMLLDSLHGLAPTHSRKRDEMGWGPKAKGYTVSLGYAKLIEKPYVPPDPAPWKGVWRLPSWPKKKGLHGPSLCSLCNNNAETTVHLILECSFSRQIWSFFTHDLDPNFTIPCSTSELFSEWTNRFPGPPSKNLIIKTTWAVLPKIICWQLWIERNRRIFRNKKQSHKVLETKIKCHIKECLLDIKDDSNLSQQDITWGSTLELQFHPAVKKAPIIKEWQIRKSKNDFQEWLKSQARHILFFDGAVKGNPGKVGAGGVVLNQSGEKIHSYAWGLGFTTSIQAEALALFQGLKALKELDINEATVIGDSQVIINAMVSNIPVSDLNLARLITRIKGMGNNF
eukprot:PITA_06464